MDKNTAIEFNNVGKQYRLGRIGTGTLSHDLTRWWKTAILGKEDPYLMIGDTNDRTTKGTSDYVWALRDITFKVEKGDVIGIIGKNGAGKSTLLKLLSHITAPSTGSIDYRGRIASLLEVGTGFHPEMTARENIFMNGSLMGMMNHEIKARLDEIVDFAGVERYLDTPVKRFSSGMTVRLGFAVAAFLEPEILVVDEVLAVGDAEFQKKAIGKMKEVSKGGGRTVLFVSHNMSAVKSLCRSGIVLKNGLIDYSGTAEECVDHYMETNIDDLFDHKPVESLQRWTDSFREMEFLDIRMLNNPMEVGTEETLVFEMTVRRNKQSIRKCQFGTVVRGTSDVVIWANYSEPVTLPDEGDTFRIRLEIGNHQTPAGKYKVSMNMSEFDYSARARNYEAIEGCAAFQVTHVDAGHSRPFSIWHYRAGSCVRGEHITIERI
jgi:ABC-type polysaccharide/polyol phosphate transport system, ATPase component